MRVQRLAKPREALLRTTAVYLFSRPNARTLHQDAAAPQQIEQLSARSLLFVPGRTKLLDKALSSDWRPDVLMPDMEDSVPPEQKVAAREAIQDFLPRLATKYNPLNTKLIPRVNSFTTGLMEEDLRAVIGNHIYGVSIGKVGSADELALIDECLTKLEHEWLQRHNDKPIGKTRLVPWLETGNGIANAREICSASCRVVGVAFGADDFLTDMGLQSSSSDDRSCATLLDHARAQIAIAARAASIVALESPFVNFKSGEGLRMTANNAKHLGMKGMFAIHPSQVDIINECFSPSLQEIEHAKAVVEAYEAAQKEGKGSTSVGGKMIDAPVVKRAYTLLRWVSRYSAK